MSYQDHGATEVSKQYQQLKDQYVWVDVRTKEEFDEGHIPGAVHIPHDEMEHRYMELSEVKHQPIMLICRSGRRSVYAAEILAEKGFADLHNLYGGMLEWSAPTEK